MTNTMMTLDVPLSTFNLTTVKAILILAHDPAHTQAIRRLTLKVCEGARTKYACAQKIFYFLKKNLRYVRDPIYREFVQEPHWLLKRLGSSDGAGDCDDFSAVTGAMLTAIGVPMEVVLSEDPSVSNSLMGGGKPVWSHVYVRAYTEQGVVPVDASMWFLEFGEEVPGRKEAIRPESLPHEQLTGGLKAISLLGSTPSAGRAEGLGVGLELTAGYLQRQTAIQMAQAKRDAGIALTTAEQQLLDLHTEISDETTYRDQLINYIKSKERAPLIWGMAAAGAVGLFLVIYAIKRGSK